MAPETPARTDLGSVLIIGGCGFLGHHIVDLLLFPRYTASISVLDLSTTRNRRPASDNVHYYEGDITTLSDTSSTTVEPLTGQKTTKHVAGLLPIFQKIKPDVVIHTASPNALMANASNELYRKVNVEGTKCVIEACQKTGVKALVYTSSASVISDNSASYDLINADERWPIVPYKLQTEYYSWTKAEAETAVLLANRSSSHPALLTSCIRPAGIFGPGDVQVLPPMLNVYTANRTNWQLGDNTNLYDFTHVKNVAHGHLLTATALLATSRMSVAPLDHEKIDGEVFFITNDSPIPFWDFARAVWRAAGSERGTEHVWVMSKGTGMAVGRVLEAVMGLFGRTPNLTTKQVKYACMTRYYDVGKARRRLGYRPIVGLEEGIWGSVGWFLERERVEKGEKGEKR